jgi:hypothetical protein
MLQEVRLEDPQRDPSHEYRPGWFRPMAGHPLMALPSGAGVDWLDAT